MTGLPVYCDVNPTTLFLACSADSYGGDDDVIFLLPASFTVKLA